MRRGDASIDLTTREFAVLEFLMRRGGDNDPLGKPAFFTRFRRGRGWCASHTTPSGGRGDGDDLLDGRQNLAGEFQLPEPERAAPKREPAPAAAISA